METVGVVAVEELQSSGRIGSGGKARSSPLEEAVRKVAAEDLGPCISRFVYLQNIKYASKYFTH